jgi:hypothetical protein
LDGGSLQVAILIVWRGQVGQGVVGFRMLRKEYRVIQASLQPVAEVRGAKFGSKFGLKSASDPNRAVNVTSKFLFL